MKSEGVVMNSRTRGAASLGSPPASYRYRLILFAIIGLLVSVHGATRGTSDWVLRYDGSIARGRARSAARASRAGLTVSLGVGTPHAMVSGAACLLLLAGSVTSRRWLALPALLLAVGDMQGDISDALVASWLLLLHSGAPSAAVYAFFASLVIALELYLWLGVLGWYEHGLAERAKAQGRHLLERAAPSVASSVSSVMG